jgi:hypothetical protein
MLSTRPWCRSETPLGTTDGTDARINAFLGGQSAATACTVAGATTIAIDGAERIGNQGQHGFGGFGVTIAAGSESGILDHAQIGAAVILGLYVKGTRIAASVGGAADDELTEMQFGELQATHFESVVEAFAQPGAIDCRGFRSGLGTGLQVALDCRDHVGRGLTIATNAPQAILGETVALSGFGGDPVEFGGVAGGKAHDQDSVSALMTGIHSVRD